MVAEEFALIDLRPDADRDLPATLTPPEALHRLVTLAGKLSEQRPPDPAVLTAVRLLYDRQARVQGLGPLLELGDRQLRRRFLAAVGYGPKTLHRILRFRRFLHLYLDNFAAEFPQLLIMSDSSQVQLSDERSGDCLR